VFFKYFIAQNPRQSHIPFGSKPNALEYQNQFILLQGEGKNHDSDRFYKPKSGNISKLLFQ